jgi:hypothetical protein
LSDCLLKAIPMIISWSESLVKLKFIYHCV